MIASAKGPQSRAGCIGERSGAKIGDRSHPAAVSALTSATGASGRLSLLLDRWYYLSNSSLCRPAH